MLGPFATASRRYIAIHQVSLLSHASYSYSADDVRCPRRHRQRQQRQRVCDRGDRYGPMELAQLLHIEYNSEPTRDLQ